ncbi:MAG: putative manganese-dependent inorganic diphosphatase [Clostridiales bacterium]|nr:putative manganese-dependent inorganic diphosphatase [Clostridiales bacterium]
MSDIYVVGHKNPDTDAVVSAMAYANLRNASGDREYKAARLDHISDETKRMLKMFGFDAPIRLKDVRTQVCDIDYDTPTALDPSVTLDRAWKVMTETNTTSIPVVNSDGTLYGTLTAGDIATFNLNTIDQPEITDLPLFNLLGVIEGHIIKDPADMSDSISGDIAIALPANEESLMFKGKDNIVICGDQPDMMKRALENEVSCLILCGSDIQAGTAKKYSESRTCVIQTPLDPLKVSKLIYQATPISRACSHGDLVAFHLNDYIDDVKEIVLKSRFRSYPVLDENDKVVGTLSRYHLLKTRHKKLVLVDHNEAAQAVPGLDQADILEIIDHHRLADIQTVQPIYVRNEPVGSTTTIIGEIYREHGVTPFPQMAGLMASAILSDTVMFKSPTCTKRDIAMAERLSKIAGVTIEEIGKELFDSSASDSKSAEQLIGADFKEFHIAGQILGVSQIICVDSEKMLQRTDEFLETMKAMRKKNGYDMMILMLTDVLIEGTQLLYLGNDDTIRFAFNIEPKDNQVWLPGVMSRKKQIIPMLTALWG